MVNCYNQLLPGEIERIAILVEEMGEAIQSVGKILRHGFESRNPVIPDSVTNRIDLEKECGDVLTAIELLTDNNDLSKEAINQYIPLKKQKIQQWLHYQKPIMKTLTRDELLEYPCRILVAGTRSYDDVEHFNKIMDEVLTEHQNKGKIAFISGGAHSGADHLVIQWCGERQYPCCVFKADWDNIDKKDAIIKTNAAGKRYNAMAGFDRNEDMAAYATSACVLWDKKSPGTKDMINRLKTKKIPHLVIILTENHFNTQNKSKCIDHNKNKEVVNNDPPKVLNKYKDAIPADAVWIMRPSKWGNPYVIGKDGTRDEVIDRMEKEIMDSPELQEEIKKDLKGKSLVCCCAPKRCHGDFLLRIANS